VLAFQYLGDTKYPVALWEVASQHESLYKALIEAALCLNSATDVVYVSVIKIHADIDRLDIFLLSRLSRETTTEFASKDLPATVETLLGRPFGILLMPTWSAASASRL